MTEKRKTHRVLPALCVLLCTSPLLDAAQDFSGYETAKLMQMREQTRYWDQADKDAYRNEMQSRMQSMSPDQRAAVRAEARNDTAQGAGNRYGAGNGGGQRYGSGDGSGQRYGAGDGSGQGWGRSDDAAGTGRGSGGGNGYGRGRR